MAAILGQRALKRYELTGFLVENGIGQTNGDDVYKYRVRNISTAFLLIMEFFGLTSYGVSSPIKDMMRTDYKEPEEPKDLTLEDLAKNAGNLAESIRELDVYLGCADGYAYRSFDRLKRMRKKHLMKPVGPSDMYKYTGANSMNYGWWIFDEKLKNLPPEKNWFKPREMHSVTTSEMSRFINYCLSIDKYFKL